MIAEFLRYRSACRLPSADAQHSFGAENCFQAGIGGEDFFEDFLDRIESGTKPCELENTGDCPRLHEVLDPCGGFAVLTRGRQRNAWGSQNRNHSRFLSWS